MFISTNSATINQALPIITNGVLSLTAIIISAFFGGLFAGIWTNHFEFKRRLYDKRTDKYFEHRNSIVQIEQELIPLRINISRNLASINDAIDNTNINNVRFILRFDRLTLSTGLGLKLLSLAFINMYAQLYSAIEKFNSDIDYVSGMISSVRENQMAGKMDPSLVESYKIFLPHLKNECEEIDQKSLELLALSKVAIGKEDTIIKNIYVKDGKEIIYSVNKKSLNEKYEDIKKEEDASSHKDEKQPKFVSPFLDLKKVLVKTI